MIIKLIKFLKNPYFYFYILCLRFVRYYENFSYHFENNGEALLLQRMRDRSFNTVFDIGANTGEWSHALISALPSATVYAFEPSPGTFDLLAASSNDDPRINVNCLALSDQCGEIQFRDYGAGSGLNSIVSDDVVHELPSSTYRVPVTTGDDYCRTKDISNIDFLKIDVEGFELKVLKGFQRLLSFGSIKLIQFEYGYANGLHGDTLKAFYDLLVPHGYLIGPLKSTGVLFMDFHPGLNRFSSGPNFVAVHKDYPDLVVSLSGRPITGFPNLQI